MLVSKTNTALILIAFLAPLPRALKCFHLRIHCLEVAQLDSPHADCTETCKSYKESVIQNREGEKCLMADAYGGIQTSNDIGPCYDCHGKTECQCKVSYDAWRMFKGGPDCKPESIAGRACGSLAKTNTFQGTYDVVNKDVYCDHHD